MNDEILNTIPHRPPFLFVDEIVEQDDERIHTRKTVDADEPFFKGHYPDYPIMPGVLVCECVFQAGALLIVDDDGTLAGIFTDGDLRKLLLKQGPGGWQSPIEKVMVSSPRRLPAGALVRDAVQMVREYRIDEVPIVDADGKPLGLIDVQDLMALKVIEG